jgi:hypothetical protein
MVKRIYPCWDDNYFPEMPEIEFALTNSHAENIIIELNSK